MPFRLCRYWVDILDEGSWRTVARYREESDANNDLILHSVGRGRAARIRHRSWFSLIEGSIIMICAIGFITLSITFLYEDILYGFTSYRIASAITLTIASIASLLIAFSLLIPHVVCTTSILGPTYTDPSYTDV